jgi:hypothetical protein
MQAEGEQVAKMHQGRQGHQGHEQERCFGGVCDALQPLNEGWAAKQHRGAYQCPE